MARRKSRAGAVARRPSHVVDIECEDWTTFVRGAIGAGGRVEIYSDPDRFVDELLELGPNAIVAAHAGGRYDFLFVLDALIRRKIPCSLSLSGSSVLELRVEDGPTFRDSYALIPLPLAVASEIGGVRKSELGFPCRCGDDCGGYCSIRRDMPRARMRVLEEYLEQDCRALEATLRAIYDYADGRGLILTRTIGSSAWRTAREELGLENASWESSALYRLAREGYYGGRCEVARVRASRIYRYDLHASYPAALTRVSLPHGKPRFVVGPSARRSLARERPGVYRARVRVRDCFAPPLPWRGKGRLYFPVGEFAGTWTHVEIAEAIAHGTEVLSVEWALTWPRSAPILAPFARRIWDLRAEAERDGRRGLAKFLKLFANSLTGKFAQRPEVTHYRVGEPREGDVPISPHYDVYARTVSRIPTCGHVHWAAYLTADARAELFRQIAHAGENWTYSDTDSVFSTRELSRRVGDSLGEWGFEGEGAHFRALAPKVYAYETRERIVARAKGMSGIDAEGIEDLAHGLAWRSERGVNTLLSSLRMAKPIWGKKCIDRKLRPVLGWIGGRKIDGKEKTRPPNFSEISA